MCDIVETQEIGGFFHAGPVTINLAFGFGDDLLLNMIADWLAGSLFDDLVEVIGGNGQLRGIISHLFLCPEIAGKHRKEALYDIYIPLRTGRVMQAFGVMYQVRE